MIARLDADGGSDWDDFAVDGNENAYLAQPDNAIAKIGLMGRKVLLLGAGIIRILLVLPLCRLRRMASGLMLLLVVVRRMVIPIVIRLLLFGFRLPGLGVCT